MSSLAIDAANTKLGERRAEGDKLLTKVSAQRGPPPCNICRYVGEAHSLSLVWQFAAYRLHNGQPLLTSSRTGMATGPNSPSRLPLAQTQTTAYNQQWSSSSGAFPISNHRPEQQHERPSAGRPEKSATAKAPSCVADQTSALAKPAPMATNNSRYLNRDTDIGKYDGGFERDAEGSTGVPISGDAAEILALDSSLSRQTPTKPWKLSSFELGRPLGKGKFGRVYMVRTLCEPRYIIALKCLHKLEIVEAKVEKQVRREIEIQSHLRYQNLSKLRMLRIQYVLVCLQTPQYPPPLRLLSR